MENLMAEIQARRYLNHLQNIMDHGTKIYPRGMEVREIADLQLRIDPRYPFMTFKERKYDLNYFKKEILWKLSANPYDKSIMEHAKMWGNVINPDGTFNSNYGVYWFGPQGGIWSVVTELVRDRDSRRAIIPMLSPKHTEPWVVDTVCTEVIGFRIRCDNLQCSVHMRSSDSIFGLGTDIGTFTFLLHLVRALIPEYLFPGELIVTAMSSHIYSRHYDMVSKMLDGGVEEFDPVIMPECGSYDEAMYIVAKRGKMADVPDSFKLAKWLIGDE